MKEGTDAGVLVTGAPRAPAIVVPVGTDGEAVRFPVGAPRRNVARQGADG